jgi:peptidyl-tRNA hydrolase
MIKAWFVLRKDVVLSPDATLLTLAHGTDFIHMDRRGDYLRWIDDNDGRRTKVIMRVPDNANLHKVRDALNTYGVEHRFIHDRLNGETVITGLVIYPIDETKLPAALRPA